ncbi:MAG: DUF5706 domain-containing protein [Weeksellaceae bacterium]|nr:HD domain-containing protein [Bacteroidota bacterium]MCG2781642.1 DUF5706 domain-containing protein [Weeksellaceae bacterium]
MNIVTKAGQYVTKVLADQLPVSCSFHNAEHTGRVVSSTKLLAEAEGINDKDTEILLLAAWFHDVGYMQSSENHEEIGMRIAESFLQNEHLPQEEIEQVKKIINATVHSHTPQNLLEEIIRDADTSHLGDPSFFEVTELLRNELKTSKNIRYTKVQWVEQNIAFFKQHRYYTGVARKNWESNKQENMRKMTEFIKDKTSLKEEKSILNKKKLEKMESPERGVETMLRVTINNHTQLSQIADTKANILLSVNAIIISVALSTIVPKLDAPRNAHLVIPTFVMVGFSVASILMAIISTRPKVTGGVFAEKDIKDRKVNLLFFGNFHNVPVDEYTAAMKEMMKDKDYLYESMIKDLYYLGVVLNRKYRLLRTTYTVFTVGILVSVLSFYLAFRGFI